MKVKINGKSWSVETVTQAEMEKERADGASLAGLCIAEEKRILIAEDCVSYENIAHELFHSYFLDLHLDDTNTIPLIDIEEIMASHFADKGEEMVKKAKQIYKKLSKKKE